MDNPSPREVLRRNPVLAAASLVALLAHGALVVQGMGAQPWIDEIQAAAMALHAWRLQIAGHHMAGNALHEAIVSLLHALGLAPLVAARTAGLVAWAALHTVAWRHLRNIDGAVLRWFLLAGSSALLAWWTPDGKTYGWFALWGLLAWLRTIDGDDRRRTWFVLGLGPLLAHWGTIVPILASLAVRRPVRLRSVAWALPGIAVAAVEFGVFAQSGFLPLLRVGASPAAGWGEELDAIIRWVGGGGWWSYIGVALLLILAFRARRRGVLIWTCAAVAQVGLHVALAGAAPVRYLVWWLPPLWLSAAEVRGRAATAALLLIAVLQFSGLRAVSESPAPPGPSLDAAALAATLAEIGGARVLFDLPGTFGDGLLAFAGPATSVATVLAPPHAAESCRWLRYAACSRAVWVDPATLNPNDTDLWLLIPDMPRQPRAGWFPWWEPTTRDPLGESLPGRRAIRGAVLIPAAALPSSLWEAWSTRPPGPAARPLPR